ncbi:hypothetical protein QFC20_004856 [Naganishia adeliensis]|uniref:Uncharacterized protein n=1 Tax=Naganishia adeliensis TaxID=92952 RepID=A0ACC2VVX4_9TREE|nr:hypothetical protein QFC20_004856 [Naganishia adeliensis]
MNPHARPRLIEFHEQPYTPPAIRRPVQDMLTFAWTHRVWPLQHTSPAVLAGRVLESVLGRIGDEGKPVAVVDFCSGAGGPIPTIERVVNEHCAAKSLPATPFILTDLHPHTSAWHSLHRSASALSYISTSVDATRSSRDQLAKFVGEGGRHIRTFFLAFHHFDEKGAEEVIRDAMENADAIGIFELQEFNLGSLLVVTGLFPLTWLATPFLRPSLLQLFFTYIVPIIPLILVLDGYVSAYRTRTFAHIKYLADRAAEDLEKQGKQPTGARPWVWEQGRAAHTAGIGKMYYIVGRRADV